MQFYSIDLDDFGEEIFHELERVQDGKGSHRAVFIGQNKEFAADRLLLSIRPFIVAKFYNSDQEGYKNDEEKETTDV